MCAVCILPRIFLATMSFPFRTRADELGTLAGAAFLAGYDWSDLMGHTAYYGFGASVFLAPLFWIIKDPLVQYKIMIGIWGVLQGLVGVVAWKIGRDYFYIKDQKTLALLSIIGSYMVVTRNTALFNETPMILLTWLICWCLLALNRNNYTRKRKYLYTICLIALLSYSLTLHTRAIVYWIAAIILEIVYFLVTKRTLYSVKIAAIFATAGFLISKCIISSMQNHIWLSSSRNYVTNTKIGTGGLKLLLEPENWQAWVNIILGQINTLSLVTGTLIIIAFVWIIKEFFSILKNKLMVEDEKIPYLCIMGFAAMCTLGTIFGQSISEWLGYVSNAMKNGFANTAYDLKAVTYIRYVGPYIGVLVWSILVLMLKKQKEIFKVKNNVIAVTLIVQVYWLACILPYIYPNTFTNEAYLPFGLINNFDNETRCRTYLAGTVVIVLFLLIFWVILKFKNRKILLSIFMAFYIYQYVYDGYYNDIFLMRDSYSEINETYNALKILNEEELLSKEIGILDVKNSSHSVSYVYQFCFPDAKIITLNSIDDRMQDYNIVITNGEEEAKAYTEIGYYSILVDNVNSSYILTKDEEVKNILETNFY